MSRVRDDAPQVPAPAREPAGDIVRLEDLISRELQPADGSRRTVFGETPRPLRTAMGTQLAATRPMPSASAGQPLSRRAS